MYFNIPLHHNLMIENNNCNVQYEINTYFPKLFLFHPKPLLRLVELNSISLSLFLSILWYVSYFILLLLLFFIFLLIFEHSPITRFFCLFDSVHILLNLSSLFISLATISFLRKLFLICCLSLPFFSVSHYFLIHFYIFIYNCS